MDQNLTPKQALELLAQAATQFRGTRYCHFIAPEYLRRLLQGEAPQAP